MIYLLLAILSSALISVLMRLSNSRVNSSMAMFAVNYALCAVLSRAFMGSSSLFTAQPGMGMALGLGAFSGVMYLASFLIMQHAIRSCGLVMSTTFTKLGVIIPTLIAIVVFGDKLKPVQIPGLILALTAIVLAQYEKPLPGKKSSSSLPLIATLLCSGFTDSIANLYEKLGTLDARDHYLFFTFAVALLCSVLLGLKEKKKPVLMDVLFGLAIGVPNYFSSRFLLSALGSMPAVIVYPAFSVGTIALIAVIGIVFFREKPGLRKLVAVGIIALSLVLLNI